MSAIPHVLAGLLTIAWLAGAAACEKSPPAHNAGPETLTRAAVSVEDGMILLDYPGPKGQVRRKDGTIEYFCDTVGLLKALHDPGRKRGYDTAYVQAFDGRPWDSYTDGWVEAPSTVYVIGSDRMGAMGPTFVPFSNREVAGSFAQSHGGKVVPFAEIDADVLARHGQMVQEMLRAKGTGAFMQGGPTMQGPAMQGPAMQGHQADKPAHARKDHEPAN